MISMLAVRRCLTAVSVLFALTLAGSVKPIGAQEVPCIDVIDRFRTALTACDVLNNNDLCYGNVLLDAQPANERFERPRDRIPIEAVDEIVATNQTGTVVMYLSVGEADPVKVITVGDVNLTPDDEAGGAGSFTVSTSEGSNVCEATPPGLLVYTESGEQGSITVNGMAIELASVAFIALNDPDDLTITNMDGTVRVGAAGELQNPPIDSAVTIAETDDGPTLVGTPSPSNRSDSDLLQWLAFDSEGMASIQNLNKTPRNCNLDDVTIPFTGELELHEPGHECQITFCAERGDVVSVELESIDAGVDPWLDLRRPNARLLTFSDDRGSNDQGASICNQTLPADGCYMVVARSYRNESAGRLRLILDGQTDCEPPMAICEVTYPAGLNLRSAPDQQAPLIRALVQGTRLLPIAKSADNRWLEVQVERTQRTGWVWNNVETVSCGGEIIPTVTPTPTPDETPNGDDDDDDDDDDATSTPMIPEPGPTKSSPFAPP